MKWVIGSVTERPKYFGKKSNQYIYIYIYI